MSYIHRTPTYLSSTVYCPILGLLQGYVVSFTINHIVLCVYTNGCCIVSGRTSFMFYLSPHTLFVHLHLGVFNSITSQQYEVLREWHIVINLEKHKTIA